MIKKRFFDISRLLKAAVGVILNTLMVCTLVPVCADEMEPRRNVGGTAGETFRPEDAKRPVEAALSQTAAVRQLELEANALRAENAALRSELLEIRKKLEKQDKADRALRLWLAAVPSEGIVRKSGEREEQLLNALGQVFQSGNELALKTTEFCDEVRSLMRELPIGKVRQAEIRLRLDAAASAARRMIGLTEYELGGAENSGTLRSCRILAVDRTLSVVILSVGSANGAFPGLTYRAGKNGTTWLRVVCVRPFVAAAVVLSGSIDDLAPGMEAATERKADRDDR